jgi:hypothetical protein
MNFLPTETLKIFHLAGWVYSLGMVGLEVCEEALRGHAIEMGRGDVYLKADTGALREGRSSL